MTNTPANCNLQGPIWLLHLVAVAEAEYEPVMPFLNHSCEPNVGFAGNIALVAMREISPGEELATDYALFDDCDGEMDCRYGRASCRGTISGRDWRRPELQRKYRGLPLHLPAAPNQTEPRSSESPGT